MRDILYLAINESLVKLSVFGVMNGYGRISLWMNRCTDSPSIICWKIGADCMKHTYFLTSYPGFLATSLVSQLIKDHHQDIEKIHLLVLPSLKEMAIKEIHILLKAINYVRIYLILFLGIFPRHRWISMLECTLMLYNWRFSHNIQKYMNIVPFPNFYSHSIMKGTCYAGWASVKAVKEFLLLGG